VTLAQGAAFGLLALCLSGCGLNMQQHYAAYRPYLLQRDFPSALEYVENSKVEFYGKKNRLLYYFDRGMLLHLAGRYQDSNQVLEQAKTAADELWTESVAENAAAWVTTDNSLSYAGEDFEKVLCHFIAAQNYLALGDASAARVEARQITQKLELYNQRYEALNTTKSLYRDDAFARWLSGLLAQTESGREAQNDAWIDFKKALATYRDDYARYGTPVPQQLVQDALRVLQQLGPDFAPELEGLTASYPTIAAAPLLPTEGKGRLVLLHSAGEAPHKVDDFWIHRDGRTVIRIAFPKFISKVPHVTSARMRVGALTATAELAEDVSAIAVQNLADHMARIRAKAIARAVFKFAVGETAQQIGKATASKGGGVAQVAGTAWKIGQAIAEEADKRSWVTLPARVNVSELWLDPGPTEVVIEHLDSSGRVVLGLTETRRVTIEPGASTFVFTRTFE
jgi:hypothetical protein